MQKITPFLWFDTQAEEAANFYVSVFKNSKITNITRQEDAPGGAVVVVNFELDGEQFIALNGGPVYKFNEAVSFMIHCDDQQEVDHYWDRLSEGGKEIQCGWLTDKYGLAWQVTPKRLMELLSDQDPGRAQRAMQAMLGMVKINIAEIEKAADG